MASSSSRQNSRFSTLKVFKFGGSAAKPPPPPPKDPYYLPNHSLASLHQTPPPMLSPPSQTRPTTPASATPLSAGYESSARSPSPTSSYHMINYAPSFAASRTTLAPSSGSILSPEPISEPGSSRKGFFKFASLGKRPKTPRSASSTSTHSSEPPSDTAEDPGISRPWNFQVSFFAPLPCAGLI
ncbi:hypothetical protein BC629DRAFT_397899 [Irpex lacteus]|nr:hypothetical protein BC629DRAFT_397899 [Irpex lacteus]